MTTVVLDASVAAKWFLPKAAEPLASEAAALLDRYARGDMQFLVPDLFWPELANVFWKAARMGRWSHGTAEASLRLAFERNIPTVPSSVLLLEAFDVAHAFGRSVYDSIYVAAALAAKAQLVTADERLANALGAHLPVKWLGTYL